MSREALAITPSYPINGVGPYQYNNPYTQGALQAFVEVDDRLVALATDQYVAVPLSSNTSGSIALTTPTATAYDGRTLYILRQTDIEQGFAGQSARENGLAAQLDWMTEAIQDTAREVRRSLRSTAPINPFPIKAGRILTANFTGDGFTFGPTIDDISQATTRPLTAKTIASLATMTSLVDGQRITVESGENGQSEEFDVRLTGPQATIPANGKTIIDAVGMGDNPATRGRIVSTRKTLATFADLLTGDLRWYDTYKVGEIVEAEGHRYKVGPAVALDQDATTASGVRLYLLKGPSNAVAVEAFGAVSGPDGEGANLAANTAAIQRAWNFSGRTGCKLTYLSESLSDPYYVSVGGLHEVDGMRMEGGPNFTVIQAPVSEWGKTGFFINRLDDGLRYYRGEVKNMWFATATSSVSAAQDANQNLAAIPHVAMEQWEWSNIRFTGFGQGGLIIARAEGGAEGLGYVNTTQDGNYNEFSNINGNSCGKYRTDEQSRAVVVALFKANSNNFRGIYSRGNAGSSALAIVHGGNNNMFGGSGESLQYSVRLGRLAVNNNIYSMRGEGVTAVVKGYPFEGTKDAANNPLLRNMVYSPHLSSGTSELELDAGSNVWIMGTAANPLTMPRTSLHPSAALQADGLLDVLGIKHRSGTPAYLMATGPDGRTTNSAEFIPTWELRSNHTGPSGEQIIGAINFGSGRVSDGGVNARIAAICEGGGATALSIQTGTSNNPIERLRIRSNGAISLGAGVLGPTINEGSGSPEGVVTARIGSTYHRRDGGAGTTFYVKESGSGNTGWVGK